VNSFIATLQQLGPARLGVMGAIILGLLMFFVFISMRVSSPDMKLLYTDLSSEDSSAIAAKLEETEIVYEISADGARVSVPSKDIGKARMLLAAEGLPNGGSLGYEIFDKQSGFGTTNFVQNINQVRALEGELARTISSLDNIRSARVHIVLPQRELFSRETKTSSASVFLGIRPGSAVEQQQIISIQSLVASAIPNLKAANVSIIDSNGNLLAKGGDEDADILSLKAEDLKRSYESRLTHKIEDQVSRIVGFGKVTAIVTAEMNFDRISTNEEKFDPEGQVLRSTQTTNEANKEREPASENVSVANNLPGVGGDILNDTAPTAESQKTEEVANYEISKVVRNTVREAGEIKKLYVSVVVDGKYAKDADGKATYEPRSQEEMDKIRALIRSAAGLDETRGDVLEVANMQFIEQDTVDEYIDDRMLFGFEKSDLVSAAEVLIVSVLIILVVLLVLQPMVGKILAIEKSQSNNNDDDQLLSELLNAPQQNPALMGPNGQMMSDEELAAYQQSGGDGSQESLINIAGIEGKVKASSLKKVEEIVEAYPNETVSVIRSWMTQEG